MQNRGIRKLLVDWMVDVTQPHAFGSTLGDELGEGKENDEELEGTSILVEEVQKIETGNVG